MSRDVLEFNGHDSCFSNFFPLPITFLGVTFPTAEHAYQWAKARTDAERAEVRAASTPGQAKRIGARFNREEWHAFSLQTMFEIVWIKFSTNPHLKARLLETGDGRIEEGNTWGDTFWGVVKDKPSRNELGKILMQIRAKLREAEHG